MNNVIEWDDISELCSFMVEQVKIKKENSTDGYVNWDYVAADVCLEYKGKYDSDMITQAIHIITEISVGAYDDVTFH
jgi:hypothetical protein